jgi:TRAP-type C4-dicarboxylate transport system permease small subunit
MMARLDTIIGSITRVMVYAATAAGALLCAFVALAAFMRYFVSAPFAFTEELVGLLFSAMVFLALPYCTYAGRHIRVTLLTDHLPPAWRAGSAVASTMLTILVCAAFGWIAFDFAATSYALGARSDFARLPLWPWMAMMPLACLVMAIAALLRAGRPDEQASEGAGGA